MDNFHKYTVFFFFISGKSDNFAGLQFYAVGRRRSLTSRNSGQNIRGMVSIFYRSSGKIVYSQSMSDLTVLKHEDVIWIDLFSPTGDEKRATEAFLDTEIQSRAQAEEIESSSRFSETDTAILQTPTSLSLGRRSMRWRPCHSLWSRMSLLH